MAIAAIANVSAALISIGWDGFGISPDIWAIAILLRALVITAIVAFDRRDVAYGAVIAWAPAGIVANQSASPAIAVTIIICVAVILAAFAVSLLYRRRSPRKGG